MPISFEALRENVLKMVELLEICEWKDTRKTRGAVMHDGWSHNRSHFLALFSFMMKPMQYLEEWRECVCRGLGITVLSISPISKKDEYGEVVSAHTTTFDAESHIHQLEHILTYYHVDVQERAVCQNCGQLHT